MAGSWPAPTPSRPGRPLPWPRPHSPTLSGENEGKPPFLRRGSEKGSVARTAESSFRVLCPGATTVRPTTPSPSAPAPGHSWREVTQQLLAPPQPHNSTQCHSRTTPSASTRTLPPGAGAGPSPRAPPCFSTCHPHPAEEPHLSSISPNISDPPPVRTHRCPLALITPSRLALDTLCLSCSRFYNSHASGREGWSQAAWVQIAALPLLSCVAMDKLLNLSGPSLLLTECE